MDPVKFLFGNLPHDTCQVCHKVMNIANTEGLCPICNPSGLKIGSRVRLVAFGQHYTIGTVESIVDGKPVVNFENGIEPITITWAPATDYEMMSESAYAAELQASAEYAEAIAIRNQGASEKWGFMFQEV